MRQKELILAVYLPTALLSVAQGVLLVTLPLYAADLGVGYMMISIITSAAAMGTLVSDIPAGVVLHRVGLRRSMLLGCALVVVGTMGLTFELSPEAIVSLRVVAGIGTALWSLSRHSFLARAVPAGQRGQAIAMFGGINRIGMFGGPAIGGVIATGFGMHASFFIAGLLGVMGWIAAAVFVPKDLHGQAKRRSASSERWKIVRQSLRLNAADISAAGLAQVLGQMIRQGRQLLIPLIGAQQLGLNAAEIGTILTIAAVVDIVMFMPAGFIMDRFGRKLASVPSFGIMAIGIGLVPLAHSFVTLMAVSILIGFGNGLGAGAMMTLGADLAPMEATGEFLGIWRLIGDVGMVIGPLMVGVFAGALGLNGSAYALMVAGLAASTVLAFLVKETRIAHIVEPESGRVQPSSN